ncbi:YLP motif-containing protein [Actinidia chinensis var. chinensis]|uniref:YLP motif-containing protein n=1 Tax=Actinidia chinensis var. chinensis TaxID=1590841 RepID=A0A2R6PSU5_ACTCC|nr:YLP motif-containing protein [Actinidia chinensis var. chinensis]
MDHQWRPRPPPPPVPGNLCPTCSFSHFPFCPPPHPNSFNQNPRFIPHNAHSSQRPFFDPLLDHPGPNANFQHRFGDPPDWHRNPNLEYEQFQIGESGMVNGFAPSRYDNGGVGFKRVRVDDMGPGSFVGETGISDDRERRLKLIRDHGVDGNRESDWHLQENPVFERTLGGVDGGERGRLDLRGVRNDMMLKPPSNCEISEFQDPRFSDFDRKGTYFRSGPDFNPHNYGEEHGLDFDQRNLQRYRNEELVQSQYGQGEKSLLPSLLSNGHSPQDPTHYHEGGLYYDSNFGDDYSRGYSEVLSENYYHHPRSSDSLSAKEPHSSHSTGWQGPLASSARFQEQRSSLSTENRNPNYDMPRPYGIQNSMRPNHDMHSHGLLNDRRQSYEASALSHNSIHGSVGNRIISDPMQASQAINVQPPLPASPPPPLPVDPPGHPLSEPHALSSSAVTSSSLFPIPVSSVATLPSSYAPIPEAHSLSRPYFHDKSYLHASTGIASENINRIPSTKYLGEGQPFHMTSLDKPKVVDASQIFKQPHRATRPDHIVIILRGLPGSGKSYLAKMLRDLEVENGGDAPRIHSMDDYFMTEVEKVEESDFPKSSSSVRGKKAVMKKVMEFCYEPEMEEAYRSSMLKAFKKTLDEGCFSIVIVDDRNLRVADFAQFWATAKRSGYEVYLLEASYKDPVGCAARNVHGFTQDDIQKMAGQWEEAPSLYLKLEIKSLFQGDDLKESGIREVDMDTEDGDSLGTLPVLEERNSDTTVSPARDYSTYGSPKHDKKWDAEGERLREVKVLSRSKWSDDLDDDNAQRTEGSKGNLNALSGLIKTYAKEGKSVHWGDQVGSTGFSIGAARKVNISIVIGPGGGYNLKSNPLPEEHVSTRNTGESKTQSVFQERMRAERESFRSVFDKRRQRIGGLALEEE